MKCIVLTGSPPPMRGKDTLRTCDCAAIGITPAYAGKSCDYREVGQGFQDHPRLCGEKTKRKKCVMLNTGSPPPMRGKAKSGDCDRIDGRITPAYAGKR